jgi:prepilin-type N-terminal cleavage/methylation domain-containing protein
MASFPSEIKRRRGFTLPEVLVVIGIIGLMIAIIVPALAGALRTGDTAKSMNRMKQIGLFMRAYEGENRAIILPSQADYNDPNSPGNPLNNFPVKVRSDADLAANRYEATWADILWTLDGMGEKQALINPGDLTNTDRYFYDSPDESLYLAYSDYDDCEFRSSAPNSRDFPGGSGATPFGTGAKETGLPGYFAANNFFNTGPAPAAAGDPPQKWWVTGQILKPDQSMYLVDSLAGETIEPDFAPFDSIDVSPADGIPDTLQVDFRYNGTCLMLFMDGHIAPQGPWTDLCDLEKNRRPAVRVRDLDRKVPLIPCP